jgi:isopenicillin N synthase-like dioxygenase
MVVDRSALEAPTAGTIASVRSACLNAGFFGIEPDPPQRECLDAMLAHMGTFFGLPDSDPRKQSACHDASRSGWQPRYSEPAYQPGTISTLEAYDFGLQELTQSTAPWPEIARFREDAEECWASFHQTAAQVLAALAAAADLESGYFAERCNSQSLDSMRLLHYAGDTTVADDRNVGIAAHTDFECITLLYQDAPGLELLSVDGRWHDATTGVGRIIVMLDDMIERWTNGFFQATGHRVRETEERRMSIVLFVAANDDVTIAPLDRFVSDSNPAKYAPVRQEQHLEDEVRRARKNAADMH